MPKYYVESGELRVVVQASSPIRAAARALGWVSDEDQLDQTVTVNERGFRQRRQPRSAFVLETGTLLGLIQEAELR